MTFLDSFSAALPKEICLDDLKILVPTDKWLKTPELAAMQSLRLCGKFDAHDYLERYSDVKNKGIDPIQHFVEHGIYEKKYFKCVNFNDSPTKVGLAYHYFKSGNFEQALNLYEGLAAQMGSEKFFANIAICQKKLGRKVDLNLRNKISSLNCKKELKDSSSESTWSAVITMWKRKDYLKEQLLAIQGQSIPPKEIIIIINENNISESTVRNIAGRNIKIITSDINSLYSRWALSYIAEGNYIAVFDDDVIPGEYWIANAIRACNNYNALVVPQGRVFNENGKHGFFKLVTTCKNSDKNIISCSDTDVFCDWGCNSYFFKREWVGYILEQKRYQNAHKTFDDIQLATSLFINAGIKCVVPMQPDYEKRLHGTLRLEYGNDSHAIWKTNSEKHFTDRKNYIKSLIDKGYIPVQQRENLFRFHLIVAFGERHFLERCLLSIKGQIYQNFTCTLIDDCCDGNSADELLQKLDLDTKKFRYIKTQKRFFPLRAREIATDMLQAAPADVIVHLDGDDWLSCPDVLTRLNRIYSKGGVLATYGNTVSLTNHKKRNFSEYAPLEMSKQWNMAQNEPQAKIMPFRRLDTTEVAEGWGAAPWCAMHLRTFQYSKWLGLNRKSFFDAAGNYLRCATDAAILIPILDSSNFDSIVFVPDILCTYQRAGNNSFSRDPHHIKHVTQARAAVAKADKSPNHSHLVQALIDKPFSISSTDVDILHDMLCKNHANIDKYENEQYICSKKSCIVTIITTDYIGDAMINLLSYKRNLRMECQMVIFIATTNENEITAYTKAFASSNITVLFPSTLQHTNDLSCALAKKYTLGSDEYRWGMKPVILLELLKRGNDLALFLDPDMYTVSEITELHRNLFQHSVCVFPHFRDPDHTRLRGVLYKDGFFNGGMLAATPKGIPHILRLYKRCLNVLAKDPSRQRWDDQKYFDLFTLEVDDLFVNHDRGIDYSSWNYEPIEDIVSPSQRSLLLKSGFFVRIFHMASQMIKNADCNEKTHESRYLIYRPIISIYYTSLLYAVTLIIARFSQKNLHMDEDFGGLLTRYATIEQRLISISSSIPVNETRRLLVEAKKCSSENFQNFIEVWTTSLLRSIDFDNLEVFSIFLSSLFPEEKSIENCIQRIRKHDLRYIADEIASESTLCHDEARTCQEAESAGELIKKQLLALANCHITY